MAMHITRRSDNPVTAPSFNPRTGTLDPALPDNAQVPQLGARSNNVGTYTIDLATAGNEVELSAVAGSFLWAYAATSLSAQIKLRFNDQQGAQVTWQRGMVMRGVAFGKVFATWAAQAGETITLLYTLQGPPYGVSIENPLIAFQSVTLSKATTFSAPADVSLTHAATTLILAANATRRRAVFGNPTVNPVEFRIGAATAGAARGVILPPGETLEITNTNAIYGYNPDAAIDYAVSAFEESD